MRWAIWIGSLLALLLWLIFPQRTGREHYSPDSIALRAIQTIHTAEVQYSSQYGRYAASLTELGPLIGNDLANGTRHGYKFTLTSNAGGYIVNANPVTYGTDGNKTFYSDQSMVIRENQGPHPATATGKEIGRQK